MRALAGRRDTGQRRGASAALVSADEEARADPGLNASRWCLGMGGYIRMDKDLEDDPRVDDLAEALARSHLGLAGEPSDFTPQQLQILGLARDAVLGGLYRLWRYGDTYLGRHDRLKGASRGFARIQEVTALPTSLLKQFPAEWLREHADGTVELPGYSAKNALINRDQRREKGRERTRRYRDKKRQLTSDGDGVTQRHSGASQRHQNVTTGTGTGTGPDPDPPEPGPVPQPVSQRREILAPDGALASAQGHLARRLGAGVGEGKGGARDGVTVTPVTRNGKHSAAELEAFALRMASVGTDSLDIAKTLEPLGATGQQVRAWLANAPATASPSTQPVKASSA